MVRPIIVDERIKEILSGRLLRYTDIFNEYKRQYNVEPYRQIHVGLKRLQEQGEIFEIAGYYGLVMDFISGIINPNNINKALKKAEKWRKRRWRYDDAFSKSTLSRLYKVLNTYSEQQLQYFLKSLDDMITWVQDSSLLAQIPLQDEFDINYTRLFAFEYEKLKALIPRLKGGFEEYTAITMEGIARLSPKQRKKALARIEDTIKAYPKWIQKQHSREDLELAEKYLQLLKKMEERLKDDHNK